MFKKKILLLPFVIIIYFLMATIFLKNTSWLVDKISNNTIDVERQNIEIKVKEFQNDKEKAKGVLLITNRGNKIRRINGKYPIRLGISIVNADGNMLEQDYCHMDLEVNSLDKNKNIEISFCFDDLQEATEKGCSLKFNLVQEGISWFPENCTSTILLGGKSK